VPNGTTVTESIHDANEKSRAEASHLSRQCQPSARSALSKENHGARVNETLSDQGSQLEPAGPVGKEPSVFCWR